VLILIKNLIEYKELLGSCIILFVVTSLVFKDVKAIINVLVKITTLYAIVIMLLS